MNLIYSCVFVQESFINLIYLLLLSYKLYGEIDYDYLIITHPVFEKKIMKIFSMFKVNGKIWRSDNCYDLFGVGKLPWDESERYLSEDYYFSRLWSKIGGKIWADIASPLQHHGSMHFSGHVGSMFSLADDINKNTTQTGNTETDK